MITDKPISSGNTTSNALLEIFHSFLGNFLLTCKIKYTYAYKDHPWAGILSASAFAISSTTDILQSYT